MNNFYRDDIFRSISLICTNHLKSYYKLKDESIQIESIIRLLVTCY